MAQLTDESKAVAIYIDCGYHAGDYQARFRQAFGDRSSDLLSYVERVDREIADHMWGSDPPTKRKLRLAWLEGVNEHLRATYPELADEAVELLVNFNDWRMHM